MPYLLGAIFFFFGTAVGSFILVIAERYNTGLPFLKGRSICFSCGKKLSQKDLLPVLSFLFLRGCCRYCGAEIPKSAFWTEIIMGALSVLAAFKSGLLGFPIILNSYFIIQFLLLLSIFATLLLITIYDLKHFIIPDSFLIFLFLFSFLYLVAVANLPLLSHLLSGVAVALPLLLVFLISRGGWLGFGDVKYIFVIGFFLGLVQGLSAIILAFWIGAAFALSALFLKRFLQNASLPLLGNNFTIKSEIPFGPFLSLGTIASFCFNLDLFHINELFNFF